jgi:DNA-binding PadR family transcriptional regulator
MMRHFHGRRGGDGERHEHRGERHHRGARMMRMMMAGCGDAEGLRARFGERFASRFGGFDGPDGEGFGRGFGGPFGGGFGGGGFGGGRGDGFGRGRRGKMFTGEELRLMLLALLVEKPEHGYQLKRLFAERSNDAYTPSPGVLYPLLSLLEDEEMIEHAEGGTGSKRQWVPTDAGRAEVETNKEAIEALFARLAKLGEANSRTDNAPVRRAVHNMKAALMERLSREGADSEIGFEIAKIIDEATQKIERL